MAQGNSANGKYTINLTTDMIMLQRVGDWVNFTLSIPHPDIVEIVGATLNFQMGCSIDTESHTEVLSIFSKSGDTLTEISVPVNGNYISSGTVAVDTVFAALLLQPDSILSLRTNGTSGSWLIVEDMSLEVEYSSQDVVLNTRSIIPVSPKNRYRGSKEGSKFTTFAHEVAGACSQFLINRTEVPVWGGKDLDQAFSLLDLSTKFQHIRRILEYRRSLRES